MKVEEYLDINTKELNITGVLRKAGLTYSQRVIWTNSRVLHRRQDVIDVLNKMQVTGIE